MNHNNDWQEYRSGFNSEEERFEPKRDGFERPRNIYREQRTVVQRDHSSCLGNRRIDSLEELNFTISQWEKNRNQKQIGVNWQFTAEDARIKLKRLYPKPLFEE